MSWRYNIVGYKYSWILWCIISNFKIISISHNIHNKYSYSRCFDPYSQLMSCSCPHILARSTHFWRPSWWNHQWLIPKSLLVESTKIVSAKIGITFCWLNLLNLLNLHIQYINPWLITQLVTGVVGESWWNPTSSVRRLAFSDGIVLLLMEWSMYQSFFLPIVMDSYG